MCVAIKNWEAEPSAFANRVDVWGLGHQGYSRNWTSRFTFHRDKGDYGQSKLEGQQETVRNSGLNIKFKFLLDTEVEPLSS